HSGERRDLPPDGPHRRLEIRDTRRYGYARHTSLPSVVRVDARPEEDLSHDHRDRTRSPACAPVRTNRASRCLVDAAAARVFGIVDVPRLLDVGGIPGKSLHVRPVPLAVLLAGIPGLVSAQLV